MTFHTFLFHSNCWIFKGYMKFMNLFFFNFQRRCYTFLFVCIRTFPWQNFTHNINFWPFKVFFLYKNEFKEIYKTYFQLKQLLLSIAQFTLTLRSLLLYCLYNPFQQAKLWDHYTLLQWSQIPLLFYVLLLWYYSFTRIQIIIATCF